MFCSPLMQNRSNDCEVLYCVLILGPQENRTDSQISLLSQSTGTSEPWEAEGLNFYFCDGPIVREPTLKRVPHDSSTISYIGSNIQNNKAQPVCKTLYKPHVLNPINAIGPEPYHQNAKLKP